MQCAYYDISSGDVVRKVRSLLTCCAADHIINEVISIYTCQKRQRDERQNRENTQRIYYAGSAGKAYRTGSSGLLLYGLLRIAPFAGGPGHGFLHQHEPGDCKLHWVDLWQLADADQCDPFYSGSDLWYRQQSGLWHAGEYVPDRV